MEQEWWWLLGLSPSRPTIYNLNPALKARRRLSRLHQPSFFDAKNFAIFLLLFQRSLQYICEPIRSCGKYHRGFKWF